MFKLSKGVFTKGITNNLFKDKVCQILLVLGFLVNIGAWLILYLKIKPQDDLVFLHYNIYFGVDLVGKWYQIFIIPLAGLVAHFINLFFSYIIYKREKIISRSILGLSVFLQIMVLLASWLVARQNIV